MKKITLLLFITSITLFTQSCKRDKVCDDYFFSYGLKKTLNERKYCKCISRSLKGDSIAFNEMIREADKFDSGLILDHSYNVSKLVEEIGKEKICSWINSGTIDEKYLVDVMRINYYEFEKGQNYYFKEGGTYPNLFNCEE